MPVPTTGPLDHEPHRTDVLGSRGAATADNLGSHPLRVPLELGHPRGGVFGVLQNIGTPELTV